MLAQVPTRMSNRLFLSSESIQVIICLCQTGGLPSEIARKVARHLEDRDIITISTLSKELRSVANACIYWMVTLDFSSGSESAGHAALLLLRTLLTNKRIASNVTSIRLVGSPLETWRQLTGQADHKEASLWALEPPASWLPLASLAPKDRALIKRDIRGPFGSDGSPKSTVDDLTVKRNLGPGEADCSLRSKEKEQIASNGPGSCDADGLPTPRTLLRRFVHHMIILASSIRRLRFSFRPRNPSSRPRNSSPEPRISLPDLCLCIMRIASNLAYLRIESDFFRFRDFRVGFTKLVKSGQLQGLRTFALCTDLYFVKDCHLGAARHWDDMLTSLLFASKASSADLVLTLKPSIMPHLRVSTVIHLNLHHYQVDKFDLSQLFAATPQLISLNYYGYIDYDNYITSEKLVRRTSTGLQPLFEALIHVKDTLEKLVAAVDFTEDREHLHPSYENFDQPVFDEIRGIVHLKRLSALSIPYAILLGGVQREQPVESWDEILPRSLRDIAWTDYASDTGSRDNWTDAALMPVITTLLVWLAKHKQKELQQARFSLRLFDFETKFNEPVRLALRQLCRSHSVRCEFHQLTTTLHGKSWLYGLRDREKPSEVPYWIPYA